MSPLKLTELLDITNFLFGQVPLTMVKDKKKCCYGMCNSNNSYPELQVNGVFFAPFTKSKMQALEQMFFMTFVHFTLP